MFRAPERYRPRHAVILAHPSPHSFNALVANTYCEAVQGCGQEAILRDLYTLGFDPLLQDHERMREPVSAASEDVEAELEALAGTDVFVFVFPIWFGLPPAILKGYVDRVLGAGVTPRQVQDRTGQTIMRDKRLLCISSSGASKTWLNEQEQISSLRSVFGLYLKRAFGLRSYEDLHFGETVQGLDQDFVDQLLRDVHERARSVCAELHAQSVAGAIRVTKVQQLDRLAMDDLTTTDGLSADELRRMDAWWRAANYLNIGQIYLAANPLLREPLKPEHIKPRLLGHWGTAPGLNLIYVHLNRLIRKYDLNALYMAGPGHGGPALIANVWLEGSYSEVYPEVTRDEPGMLRLFRQFSTPGGVPSHVSVPTPGSIHEGGELGYVLLHAFGAVMDNPDLLVAAVVGDGEAETGPLAGSWKSIDFLNPARDGAVLPILHLNGYKISGPTVLARHSDDDLRRFFEGQGYAPSFVEGDDPARVHQDMARAMESAVQSIRAIQTRARDHGFDERPRWPLLVLRTPKGWTGPKIVDGLKVEGTFRAHQVPVADVRGNPEHLRILETWMRSYRPEELFDKTGLLEPEVAALAPDGVRRMGSNPHANGGLLTRPLNLPDHAAYQIRFEKRASERTGSTAALGGYLRDLYRANPDNFRLFCPDETNSNRLGAVFEESDRCLMSAIEPGDDHVSHGGRVMEVLSEHCCHGWLEGYTLTGRHGLFASYEAFAMIIDSMAMQHGKWIEHARRVPWRAPIPSLNYLLTSTCWRNDHNGFSHQGPGFIDTIIHRKPIIARVYLPPDANCLLSVADHCLRSCDYLNLIVIDKQPQLQWLTMEEAQTHCARGAGAWDMYSHQPEAPDIVLACAGDIPTQETIAAAWLLRRFAPRLKVRVVNIVDLMRLCPADRHPHGMSDGEFTEIFTENAPVLFAFHGYPGVIHDLLHGRCVHEQFHVRGYLEEGTTTTPFDMVVLNKMSRLHLCLDVLRYLPGLIASADELRDHCTSQLAEHELFIRENFDDLPSIKDWVWSN